MTDFLPVVIYLGLILAPAVVSLAAARLLSPRCWRSGVSGAWGIGTMMVFLAIISLGWFYAYRERILEWQ